MERIFKCVNRVNDAIPDSIIDDLPVTYKEANEGAQEMIKLAWAIKDYGQKSYFQLPFCHTMEAEAYGSEIIYDHKVGNRVGRYALEDDASLNSLSLLDLSKGRIAETLKASSLLKEMNQQVIMNIAGPFCIALSIMDSRLFYRLLRNNRSAIEELLKTIEEGIVGFILEAVKVGVDVISFADPTGTIDIVGPKIYKEISGRSSYNILKAVEGKLGQTLIHLCGKTSTSLEYIGLLEYEELAIEGNFDYFTRLKKIKAERDDVNFIGHWCLKLEKKGSEIIQCRLK